MPNAKYEYRVMGKVAKNSRNKAQKEIVDVLGADDKHNLVTITAELNKLNTRLANIEAELHQLKMYAATA